jgi:hypothetical protein
LALAEPPTGFDDPIYPVFAKEARTTDYDGRNTGADVSVEFVKGGSGLSAGLLSLRIGQ